MGKINWVRVLFGGVVAGVIFDVLEFFAGPRQVGEQFMRELSALRTAGSPTPAQMSIFVAWGVVIGILSVWFYAAARPRFGPGPKTAFCVAFNLWILWALWPHLAWWAMGLFSLKLMAIYSAKLLLWQVITTEIGAWLYAE